VADDLAEEWVTASDAQAIYGVVLDGDGAPDLAATAELRDAQRAERLSRARAAVRPVHDDAVAGMAAAETVPLTPGVVQRGSVAYAEVSGAPLAVAPDPWTDGCPVIEEPLTGPGPALVRRTYLDPRVGRALHVEVVPEGEGVNFSVQPTRWSSAG
jgi:N-methylhydantoinase B